MITITCTGTMVIKFCFTKTNFIFTKTFRCGSNKCLSGKAGAAALIDAFGIGTGYCPAGAKSHHTWENLFSILFDNSFIELRGSNLKIWEKQ